MEPKNKLRILTTRLFPLYTAATPCIYVCLCVAWAHATLHFQKYVDTRTLHFNVTSFQNHCFNTLFHQGVLLWDGFPPDFVHCCRDYCDRPLMLGDEAVLNHPKVFELRALQASQDLPHQTETKRFFLALALCTGAAWCWNRDGPFSKFFHKVKKNHTVA